MRKNKKVVNFRTKFVHPVMVMQSLMKCQVDIVTGKLRKKGIYAFVYENNEYTNVTFYQVFVDSRYIDTASRIVNRVLIGKSYNDLFSMS